MNVTELLEYTRFLLSEESENYWTDDELLRYLNQGYASCYRRAVAADRGYGAVWFDWDESTHGLAESKRGSTWVITIPKFIYRILDLRDSSRNYEYLEPRHRDRQEDVNTWYFSGSNELTILGVQPTDLRMLVYRNPVPMHIGLFGSVASSTATLNATLGSVSQQPYAYQGAIIEPTSGTAIGIPLHVTAYDRSTKTITYSGEVSGDPANSDTYEVIPDMDETHHELLCYEAANRALTKENNVAGKGSIQDILGQLRNDYINGLTPRQSQAGWHVRPRTGMAKSTYDTAP